MLDLLVDLGAAITPENSVYPYNRDPYNKAVADFVALTDKREAMWDAAIAKNGGSYPGGTAAQAQVLAPEIAAAEAKVRLYEARIAAIEAYRSNKTPEQKAAADAEDKRRQQAALEQRLIDTGHPWELAGPVIVRYEDGTVFQPKPSEYAPPPGNHRMSGIDAAIPPDPSLPTLGPTDAPGGVPRPGDNTAPQPPQILVNRTADIAPITILPAKMPTPPNPAMALEIGKWALIAVGIVVLLALANSVRRR